jgi:small-conductance mechanosensitive channel
MVIIVFLLTLLMAKIISRMVRELNQDNNALLPTSSIITNITNITIVIIGLLIILQTLGISITPLLTALGVGGLAVALALQDTLSNLFSGIQIIVSKKINPGDYIKLDNGDAGYVSDITWRNTTIRALQNNVMVIPNSKLASAIITNYTLPEKELAVLIDVGVSYDSDLDLVEKATIETAREVMKTVVGGVPDFEPFVRYHTFSDFSINFSVIMRGKEFADQYLIKHEFVKKLHRRYKTEKIEIPFPIRTIRVKSSNPTHLGSNLCPEVFD